MGTSINRGVKLTTGRSAFIDRSALRNSSIWPVEAESGPWHIANPSGNTDPDFASVILLAQGEAFIDASNDARTLTPVGSATAGVVAGKFGNAYNLPTDATDIINISGDVQVPGDFTVEMWATATAGAQGTLWVVSNGAANSFLALNYTKNLNQFNLYLNTTTPAFNIAGTLDGTFRHIALNRSGTTLKLFLDGTSIFTTTNSATLGFTGAALNRFGGSGSASNYAIDDFRITKGVGRYTANFTPPTVEFPTS